MTRVKIKCRGTPDRNKKLKLLEILFSHQVHVARCFIGNGGYIAIPNTETDGDRIFQKETKVDLEGHGFNPLMPAELKVKKSVIISKLDDVIYDREEEEIKDELTLKNTWMENELDSIFKFPNSATIKLTFTQTSLAKKCTEKGIRAFNISIPHHEVKQETFIQINCCMRCYALEEHATRDCPKDSNFKLCSECSKEGHLWYECREKNKKCVNCKENHNTLAMKCPKRKMILKEKRKDEIERQNMKYVEAARGHGSVPAQAAMPRYVHPEITKEETLKIHICVAHAHYRNLENPGSYGEELNKILTANNLPNIIIPDCPKSDTLLTVTSDQRKQKADEVMPTEIQQEPEEQSVKQKLRIRSRKPRKDSTSKQTESETSDVDNENTAKGTDSVTKTAKEVGLNLYTPQERGWPEKEFTVESLVTGLRKNTYKYTYDNKNYNEEEVLQMILTGNIKLRNCWHTVENDQFRKIRSGQLQERSPIEQRDPRIRKYQQDR